MVFAKASIMLLLLGTKPHNPAAYQICCFRSIQIIKNVSVWCGWHWRTYAVCIQRIFSKMALRWRSGDKLLNKVVFVFFAQKKCSRHFIKFRLDHSWQMDYSDDAFRTCAKIVPLGVQQLATSPIPSNKHICTLFKNVYPWGFIKVP